MIELIPKVIGYNFFKRLGYPKMLPIFLTLSMNDWCNSRCKTCNIWKNDPKEKINEQLSVSEYERIFRNYGRTYWITITGGEPFLREDLAETIRVLDKKTRPEIISIATNATVPGKIFSATKEILHECKKMRLIVNVSLDGIGRQHDEIRGMSGSFEKAKETVLKLKKINDERLTVGTNTVISRFNAGCSQKIFKYIAENLRPDSIIAELAENRAKLYNDSLNIAPKESEYKKSLLFLLDFLERERRKRKVSDIVRILRIEFYKHLINNYPLENFEGIASAYIMHNGEVWTSYSKPYIIGNLREVNYNLSKLWFSDKAREFRKTMDSKAYKTSLANAFYTNAICNPKKLLNLWFRSIL